MGSLEEIYSKAWVDFGNRYCERNLLIFCVLFEEHNKKTGGEPHRIIICYILLRNKMCRAVICLRFETVIVCFYGIEMFGII